MAETQQVSLVPNEVVVPGTEITITAPHPFSHRSAQAAITLASERVTVRLSNDGRTAIMGFFAYPPQYVVHRIFETLGK